MGGGVYKGESTWEDTILYDAVNLLFTLSYNLARGQSIGMLYTYNCEGAGLCSNLH